MPSKACQIKKKPVVKTPLTMPFSDCSTLPDGNIEKRLVASPVHPWAVNAIRVATMMIRNRRQLDRLGFLVVSAKSFPWLVVFLVR